jgi:hypothetical protein
MVQEIKCACCGGDNTHQIAVEVFFRVEDAETGVHAVSMFDGTKCDSVQINNPSPRRSGLRVILRCESCSGLSNLVVYQHKGFTLMTTTPIDISEDYVKFVFGDMCTNL